MQAHDVLTDTDASRIRCTFLPSDGSILPPDASVVTGFEVTEELNRPYRITVHLTARDGATDARELLGHDAVLLVDRGDAHRVNLCGIVSSVTMKQTGVPTQSATVELVPALAALELGRNSRIFQDQSALEVIETVLREELGRYGRSVDSSSLDRGRYATRDYCVQYQESSAALVHRLMEEEGIGYCFRHAEKETLVLFDTYRELQTTPTLNGAAIWFEPAFREWTGTEPILRFEASARLVPSSVQLSDHDWRRIGRNSRIEATSLLPDASDASAPGSEHVVDHGFDRQVTISEDDEQLAAMVATFARGVVPPDEPLPLGMVHNFPGVRLEGFTTSNERFQSEMRSQLAARDRYKFGGISLVTGLAVGRTFRLAGHPTVDADAEYIVTRVVHSSEAPTIKLDGEPIKQTRVNYHNRFECLRNDTPWRPTRRTRKPRIYGVQTARVTGPVGMDVYTDQHGRIKVKFPWDRTADDLTGDHTCWLRVSHAWAGGGGPAFMFIPRVGMEVVVSFVDGDPDRPLVTGCVYNADNPTPGLLPLQATKSFIRTRTVPHGAGYNELSFEDAMGQERIHLRAERDLDERIENNHHTVVRSMQTNSVFGDQYEEVGGDQNLRVAGGSMRSIGGAYTETNGERTLNVRGSEISHVEGDFSRSVGGSLLLHSHHGECMIKAKTGLSMTHNDEQFIEMDAYEGTQRILIESRDASINVQEDLIELRVGSSRICIRNGVIQVNGKSFPAS